MLLGTSTTAIVATLVIAVICASAAIALISRADTTEWERAYLTSDEVTSPLPPVREGCTPTTDPTRARRARTQRVRVDHRA
ncbi:hypothetical protein [Gordonia alkanivorans]|uniref:hypothetical protein n=1 Tax=Gordonia alkanivorans TaxID=84096 RepID=UPI0004B19A08|nr:hypothetical protein [Gordonia alkanivorans]